MLNPLPVERQPEGEGARRAWRWLLVVLLFLSLLWLAAYGGWLEGVPFLRLLAKGDIRGLRAYLLSFGAWAPAASALLMILQSLIAPLPAFVVTIANGMLFGLFWGALLSWSSAMVAAALCFYLSRLLGRPLVERWVGERELATFDGLVSRWGRWAVLVARLVPTVSFDVVSYAAGLTALRFREFCWATGAGMLPATLAYTYLGERFGEGGGWGWATLGLMLAFAFFFLLVRWRLSGRRTAGGGLSSSAR